MQNSKSLLTSRTQERISRFLGRLDAGSWAALEAITETNEYPKGVFIVRAGEICRKSFVIREGVTRKFDLSNGHEITTELCFENDLAVSFESYALQTRGKENIQVLSSLSVYTIDYRDFITAREKFPKLAELDILLGEEYAIWLEDRLIQFHTLSSSERYLRLLREQPHYLKHIPLTVLASYLGVSAETLSQIRKKIHRIS
jgi:hypothetical protein